MSTSRSSDMLPVELVARRIVKGQGSMLSFNEYSRTVLAMARYPRIGENIVYPALGLVGEIGEVAEHIKKVERDDNGTITPERGQKIIRELGDVLWYVAAVLAETRCKVPTFEGLMGFESIREFAARATIHNAPPSMTVLRLARDAGMVADAVILSDGKALDDHMLSVIRTRLNSIVYGLARLAACTPGAAGGSTRHDLEDVARENIGKLTTRRAEGTLHGSGSDR